MAGEVIRFQNAETQRHAALEIVTVKNVGDTDAGWQANGQPVNFPPGHVDQIPRWVFLLGLRYPGHKLEELSADHGKVEYAENQKKLLAAQIEKRKLELATEQAKLKDLENELKDAEKAAKAEAAAAAKAEK